MAAPYFVETVRRYVVERYGEEDLLEKGLRIETTLDMRDQRAAETAVRRGLEDLSRRLGFSGPIGHLDAADRARLTSGRPRPLGPTGFEVDDAEQSGPLVGLPETDTATALIDATKPGARLREPNARFATLEAKAALRGRRAGRRPPRFRQIPTPPTRRW